MGIGFPSDMTRHPYRRPIADPVIAGGEMMIAHACPNQTDCALSTYFHRRVTHLTALRVFRLGAWSAVMPVHHKGRATTSEEPARPPAGSFFAATGGRRRRLTMSRHRRRAASYPAAAKNDHMYHPSMKVRTRAIGLSAVTAVS